MMMSVRGAVRQCTRRRGRGRGTHLDVSIALQSPQLRKVRHGTQEESPHGTVLCPIVRLCRVWAFGSLRVDNCKRVSFVLCPRPSATTTSQIQFCCSDALECHCAPCLPQPWSDQRCLQNRPTHAHKVIGRSSPLDQHP
jgi:hypothetical protein